MININPQLIIGCGFCDMWNYQGRGTVSVISRDKARLITFTETLIKTEFNNCFIIHLETYLKSCQTANFT